MMRDFFRSAGAGKRTTLLVVAVLIVGLGIVGCDRKPVAGDARETNPRSSEGISNVPPAGVASIGNALPAAPSEQYMTLMHAGKNALDRGDSTNAVAVYLRAMALAPADADLHLNLANAHLQAGAAVEAVRAAEESLKAEPNSAAAYFVKGSAWLRAGNAEEAVKAFENANRIEPGVVATLFQLGLARTGMQQWEGVVAAFKEGLALDPNRLHSAAHYLMGQALIRLGRVEEGRKELQLHQSNVDAGGVAMGGANFERSKYTQARVPFRLDQPEENSIPVTWVDATAEVLGAASATYRGPVAVIDANRPGWPGLLVLQRTGEGNAFRRLANTNGVLAPAAGGIPVDREASYSRLLVGDLQNDRFEDVVVLGAGGSRLIRFATNGAFSDATEGSGLATVKAVDGTLMDLDFTGKLDLLVVGSEPRDVRVWRQFGPLHFQEITRTSGVPATLVGARGIAMEDWNRDGNLDVVVAREGGAPLLLDKQRGGPLVPREVAGWTRGQATCTVDLNNDLRPDLAVVGEGRITIHFNGGERVEMPLPAGVSAGAVRELMAHDLDADGWLDLWLVGPGVRVLRNLGMRGFQDRTEASGLGGFAGVPVASVRFADFDQDCDSDAVVTLADGTLRYLRNEGGNAHGQVKVHMVGNRSNASGLGCRIEIESGGLRLIRMVHQLPVEVGVGKYRQLDSFLVHWFNWPQGSAEVPFDCREPLLALELTIQEGSCPYLYAWDGERFRFVTDILGSAPLGLPVAPGKYVESDPEEFVRIGDEKSFLPRAGRYAVRITEELREVLYLDEVKLVVVDHEPGTEVHTTDKLRPGRPYPEGELVTLRNERPLRRATTLEGRDVTEALRSVDGRRVSPSRLRTPQLRGLAEPHGVVLDFGEPDVTRPWTLVLNGWLRFGGGMANIAASHDPSLPFPFPSLEAESPDGRWSPVDVTVGAPSGKTKTIVVDLAGKLPVGTRRLRLSAAFEIHWDRIALLERDLNSRTRVARVPPAVADLRFRGFGALQSLPSDAPLTPDYERVSTRSPWTIVPGGWSTRYGDVRELVGARDEGLALVHSGDELAVEFSAETVPAKEPGLERDFFLYVDGWDKDSDFHVAAGDRIEPLPFHGMNDQRYGIEERPAFPTDALHRRFNTRWVEGRVLGATAASNR